MMINWKAWTGAGRMGVVICWMLFLFVSLPTLAQQKQPSHSLLWQISGKGLKKPSYLFGTYHFADKGFVDTMKTVKEKLAAADAVVGELVMDAGLPMKLMPLMMLKDTTLDQLLSPGEYRMVEDYIKKISGFGLENFNRFKPAAVQMLIVQFSSPKTFTESNPAIDQYFQDYARANHKSVFGLETPEKQANILFGPPLERQKELLIKSVKEAEKNKLESEKIYHYYITQNLSLLEKSLVEDDIYSQVEQEAMLKNRNLHWMEKLPTLMKDRSLFIAVGAGHLLGEDGLIKGLRKRGFTVTPISTFE